ncbi:MAG: hypothetical protein ACFFBJ_06475 [Promethearchaeota archaeon]
MKRVRKVAIEAGLLVLSITVLSPFFFQGTIGLNGHLDIIMYTLLWYWSLTPSDSMIFYLHDAWTIVQYLPIVCLRFPFAYFMMRYYEGKTTSERLIMAGALGEIPPFLVAFVNLSLNSGPWLGQYIGPMPLHLLVGLILVKLKPPPTITGPWDVSE